MPICERMTEAQARLMRFRRSADEKPEAYYQLAVGYAKARHWEQARAIVSEMRDKFPKG